MTEIPELRGKYLPSIYKIKIPNHKKILERFILEKSPGCLKVKTLKTQNSLKVPIVVETTIRKRGNSPFSDIAPYLSYFLNGFFIGYFRLG